MIIDSHCHYNLLPIADDWQKYWIAAQASGVTDSILVGTTADSSQFAIYLASNEPHFFPTVGLHPYLVQELVATPKDNEKAKAQIDTWLIRIAHMAKLPTVFAIGEIGLDFFRLENEELRPVVIELQRYMLSQQLHIARQANKPVILHVRDTADTAYWQTLEAIKNAELTQPFVLHCVSGPMKYVQDAIALGGSIGVAGNVTYKSAENIRDLVRSVPKDRILLETDAPYLPPLPHRGKMCEPAMISLTAEFVKKELLIDPEECAKNTRQLFQLPIR